MRRKRLIRLQNHPKSSYCAVWHRPDKTRKRRIRHPHIAGWISPAIFNYDPQFYQICPALRAHKPALSSVKFVFPLGNHQHRQRITHHFSAVRAMSRIRSTPAINARPPAGSLRCPALPATPQTTRPDASNPFRGHHQRQHQNDFLPMDRSMPYSCAMKIAAIL